MSDSNSSGSMTLIADPYLVVCSTYCLRRVSTWLALGNVRTSKDAVIRGTHLAPPLLKYKFHRIIDALEGRFGSLCSRSLGRQLNSLIERNDVSMETQDAEYHAL